MLFKLGIILFIVNLYLHMVLSAVSSEVTGEIIPLFIHIHILDLYINVSSSYSLIRTLLLVKSYLNKLMHISCFLIVFYVLYVMKRNIFIFILNRWTLQYLMYSILIFNIEKNILLTNFLYFHFQLLLYFMYLIQIWNKCMWSEVLNSTCKKSSKLSLSHWK